MKKSRWFGGALLAMVLTVAGLVAAPGAAMAADEMQAYSADGYYQGYGSAYWANAGQYSPFRACDNGSGDGHRAVGYIWWQGGGLIERHAAGGSGTCSVSVNVFIPEGRWVSMQVCERNGAGGQDVRCGTIVQDIALKN
ncbi:hypothetical protein [Asanoa siamensis]|uniref:Uncharacterized protein n=1 Tax=Asanoa siamensis TaxID=926357 RepID=A0ABQ4CR14_9ACTN|nr:hypothetical protein [Asanoa siamensis]GIF73433.1 hypothetical protein Asi02nite_29510 [Asanoa siamensis]